MGTFNTYGNKGRKWGGSNPVWLTVSQKQRSGGTLDPIPPVGTIIPAGTLVGIDETGGNAKVIETFLVNSVESKHVAGLETVFVTVRGLKNDLAPKDGMKIMVANDGILPTPSVQLTMSAIENTIYDVANQEYTFQLSNLIIVKEGDILIRADYDQAGQVSVAAIPTGLTENDVWIYQLPAGILKAVPTTVVNLLENGKANLLPTIGRVKKLKKNQT